ncbi:MAG: hypothetical protein S4CHLAM37_16230 [Chlamydiia bacterium]|nr:hypothetical protein [Chlamydiia bacterium]
MSAKSKSLISVFFVFFLDNFGFALAFPIMSPIMLDPSYHFFSPEISTTLRNILLGVILGAFPLGQFFGAPTIGDMADSLGRRRLFLLTVTGTAIGFFLSAYAIYLENYPFLLAVRFLSGLVAGNLSICLASIVDLSETEEEKRRNFSFISTIGGVSWVVSIFINGLIANPKLSKYFSPSLPFWICGLLLLVSVTFILKWYEDAFIPEKKAKVDFKKGFREITMAFADRELRMIFIVALFWYVSSFILIQWVSPYYIKLYKASQLQVTYLLIAIGVAWTLGSCVINVWFSKFIGTLQLFIWSTFIMFLSLLVVPFYLEVWFLYTASSLSCLCAAIGWANFNNIVSLAGRVTEQGKLMGINQAMAAMSEVIAPMIGGLLVFISYGLIFYASACFAFIAFLLMLFEKKRFVARSHK